MQSLIPKMRKNRKKGFTLVELTVVIAILAVLAAILVPTMTGLVNDAKEATVIANTRTAYTAATAAWTYLDTHPDTTTTLMDKIGEYTGTSFPVANITCDPATYAAGTNLTSVKWHNDEYEGTYTVATGEITVAKYTAAP